VAANPELEPAALASAVRESVLVGEARGKAMVLALEAMALALEVARVAMDRGYLDR
jgi:hypothetical protein